LVTSPSPELEALESFVAFKKVHFALNDYVHIINEARNRIPGIPTRLKNLIKWLRSKK
jgi:hypothetical protein